MSTVGTEEKGIGSTWQGSVGVSLGFCFFVLFFNLLLERFFLTSQLS